MLSDLEVKDGFIRLTEDLDKTDSHPWVTLPNSVQMRLRARGVLEVKPANQSDTSLVFSCGIHGNETAPIEIVSELIVKIVGGKIEPKVNLLFILGNPESMKIEQRFISLNMNRLFNGAYESYERNDNNAYELERAKELESHVSYFFGEYPSQKKYHFDLHTAIKASYHKTFAIRPFDNQRISSLSKDILSAMGIEAVLQHNKPSTTFSSYSVETFSAEAYTLELGKVKPFGKNNPEDFSAAISSFENLIQEKALLKTGNKQVVEYKVVSEIIRHSENFKFHVPENVENFTAYPQGYLIAEDIDYNYRVAFKEESVIFPNINVPVGQRVAVMVTRV